MWRPRHGLGRTNAAGKCSSRAARRSSATAAVGILEWQHRGAEQAPRIRGAVLGQPIVVGARQDHRGRRIVDRPEVEADARVEDGDVDPFEVHVAQALHRIEAAALGLLPRNLLGGIGFVHVTARCAEQAERRGDDLLRADVHRVQSPIVAHDARRVLAMARVQVTVPQSHRFQHVTIGVDDARRRWAMTTPCLFLRRPLIPAARGSQSGAGQSVPGPRVVDRAGEQLKPLDFRIMSLDMRMLRVVVGLHPRDHHTRGCPMANGRRQSRWFPDHDGSAARGAGGL